MSAAARYKKVFSFVLAFSLVFTSLFFSIASAAGAYANIDLDSSMLKENYDTKTKYKTWTDLGLDMGKVFNNAIYYVENGDDRAAYEMMNFAYFGFYEVQGFEATVMNYIEKKRVNQIESIFRDIKHSLLGNKEHDPTTLSQRIRDLAVKVYKDSMVLSQKATKDDPDSLGEELYKYIPDPFGTSLNAGSEDIYKETLALAERAKQSGLTALSTELIKQVPDQFKQTKQEADEVSQEQLATSDQTEQAPLETGALDTSNNQEQNKAWYSIFISPDFNTAFWLLIREGLEAILVVVAIVAYLVKTNNRGLIKHIYLGCLAAILASIGLAVLIQNFVANAGVARELIEGWTMFLAVLVLFYVSNWILNKSETVAWENYIDGMVQNSISKKSKITLVFAAFLAVFREGAELILFYTAAFGSGFNSGLNIGIGIALAVVVLAIIWVLFRYTTVKLPLKPFFKFTSLLLFVLCVSFMGKGVVELTEAGVIVGGTIIPAMNGFSLDFLNIYDRAETLIPQIMIVIAALAIYIGASVRGRKLRKASLDSSQKA